MHILNKTRHTDTMHNILLLCFFPVFSAHATAMTLPHTFAAGNPISASQMMGNFSAITSAISSISSPWVISSSNIYFNTGSVGIGSSAPAHALDVNGSINATGKSIFNTGLTVYPVIGDLGIMYSAGSGAGNSFSGGTATAGYGGFSFGHRFRTTSYTGGFGYGFIWEDASETLLMSLNRTGDFYVSGTAYKPGGGSWAASSDQRVKRDISPFVDGLSHILKLCPIKYKYNGKWNTIDDGNEYIGLMAQEAEKITPYIVSNKKSLKMVKPKPSNTLTQALSCTFLLMP